MRTTQTNQTCNLDRVQSSGAIGSAARDAGRQTKRLNRAMNWGAQGVRHGGVGGQGAAPVPRPPHTHTHRASWRNRQDARERGRAREPGLIAKHAVTA